MLEAMGVVPMVLRSRAAPEPPKQVPQPSELVVSAPKITLEVADKPKAAPVAVKPAAVPTPKPAIHLAVVAHQDWLVMAQLPSWTGGLLEANCKSFLRDLCIYLQANPSANEVLTLDSQNHTQYGEQALVGLVKGRLTRASKQGVRRVLLLADLPAISAGIPESMALYTAGSLEQLFAQPDAKKALWTTLVKMNSN